MWAELSNWMWSLCCRDYTEKDEIKGLIQEQLNSLSKWVFTLDTHTRHCFFFFLFLSADTARQVFICASSLEESKSSGPLRRDGGTRRSATRQIRGAFSPLTTPERPAAAFAEVYSLVCCDVIVCVSDWLPSDMKSVLQDPELSLLQRCLLVTRWGQTCSHWR